jgi:2-polyprenyl-6-methoxyphenol hydroxylase-like FAD-dependent oxidoreductase
MPTRHVDVLVIGGGPVGVLVGALLAQDGVDVLVVERRPTVSTASRAIGLHPPGLDALARVGAAAPLLVDAVPVRTGVARSRGRTLGRLSFERASTTFPFVATMPSSGTDRVLRERFTAIAPGRLLLGTTVTAIDVADPEVVRVTIETDRERNLSGPGASPPPPTEIVARFVVAADGARSPVRAMLGVRARRVTYPDAYAMGDFADPTAEPTAEAAATATPDPDTATPRDAVIDVGPHGVVEAFPLPGAVRRFVAWVPTPFDDRAPGAADRLADLVHARTGTRPDPTTCTMLSGFRVHRGIVDRMVHGRVVLVGDAAHEISPIGGQGMNLGWLDAVALVPLLASAIRTGGAVPVDTLVAFETRQLRRARSAARQAEWNMRLGRPASGPVLRLREGFLRAALGSPVSRFLADVYSMRFV